jgi:hypothetical protein
VDCNYPIQSRIYFLLIEIFVVINLFYHTFDHSSYAKIYYTHIKDNLKLKYLQTSSVQETTYMIIG